MTTKDVQESKPSLQVRVRRIHRRDLNKTWEFVKLVFRDVNRETVEYQRPRSKRRFLEVYDQEGIEQLLFETETGEVVGYAECAFDALGDDNWINPRYFDKRGMRPLYIEELAVHPDYQGRGVGSFILDQLHHLARVRGCTHLVLEVAENNDSALSWYRRRNFFKLDAALFMAQKISAEPELLPPRKIPVRKARKALPAEEGKPAKAARPGKSAKPAKPARPGKTPAPAEEPAQPARLALPLRAAARTARNPGTARAASLTVVADPIEADEEAPATEAQAPAVVVIEVPGPESEA
jgi:ribosomal protein S18 acetylase RimI-like enzyme